MFVSTRLNAGVVLIPVMPTPGNPTNLRHLDTGCTVMVLGFDRSHEYVCMLAEGTVGWVHVDWLPLLDVEWNPDR